MKCARQRPSCLLKEVSEFGGRDDESDHWRSGDVPPGVPYVRGHMEVIARFRFDPGVALAVLPQTLHLTREDEKVLCIGVSVKWNKDTGRDGAPQHTEVIVCFLRRCQQLHGRSKDIETHAGGGIQFKTHMI